MKSQTTIITLAALLACSVQGAWSNNPPISGRHPGYTYGTGPTGIEFEMIYDLLCSDT
jgi:hypothetical protein